MSRSVGERFGGTGSIIPTLATGTVLGAVAYVVNYFVILALTAIDGGQIETDSALRLVGNVMYNAQFVPSEMTLLGQTVTANFVTKSASNGLLMAQMGQNTLGRTVPTAVYHLAPIVVLAVAGAATVRLSQPPPTTWRAPVIGLAIVPGTLVLSIVGVSLFTASISAGPGFFGLGPDSLPVELPLVKSALLVGVAVPAGAGAVGGAVSAIR